jgi:hypothetical protein
MIGRLMRTTVDIPDPVYRRLKSRAATEGSSAKELILRGVKQVLKGNPRRSQKRMKLPIIRSGTLELGPRLL